MKSLQYTININAPREKVWEVMLGPETYVKWVHAAWPGSGFSGDWSEGSEMRFEGEGGGGTAARITEARRPEFISAEHFAVINNDGTLDRQSDMAKDWIGTTESYTFNAENGGTGLVVDIATSDDWVSMFDEGWPVALQSLKKLAEQG